MQCWTRFFASFLLSFLAIGAQAQGLTREAPKDVTPAIMAVSATPPIITVNGQPDRLSPGSRVRDLNNMLVLSGAMAGKTYYTVYKRDPSGLVHEVWLLTAEEYSGFKGVTMNDPSGVNSFLAILNAIFTARLMGLAK